MAGWFTTKDGKRFSPEERRLSSRKTKEAIRRGDIPAPKKCARCGQVDGILHYHNHDYSDPIKHVEPLCWRCHMMVHSAKLAPDPVASYFTAVASGKRWPPVSSPDFGILERDHGVARPKRKTLRLVVWNCNMALHRKWQYLEELDADIAIIPESAQPEILRKHGIPIPETSHAWYGKNSHKGLGVFAFGDYKLSPLENPDPSLTWILPLKVSGPREFTLFGVWAWNTEAKRSGLTRPLIAAIQKYSGILGSGNAIVAGDFNSSVKFRSGHRQTEIVKSLSDLGLSSAYHRYYGVEQGAESHPTIYWRDRSKEGSNFHIDYCFLPTTWCHAVRYLSVGSFENWVERAKSDHAPLIVEIDDLQ